MWGTFFIGITTYCRIVIIFEEDCIGMTVIYHIGITIEDEET